MNEESKKELLNLKGNLLTYLQKQPYYQPNRKGFFLCQDPEHQDTNPSMMFNKKNNTCHCRRRNIRNVCRRKRQLQRNLDKGV